MQKSKTTQECNAVKKKIIKKLPYIFVSSIISLGCCGRILCPGIFLWLGVILYAATGVIFVVGALRKDTIFYHTYIGWAWMIPTVVFVHIFITDNYSNWNRWYVFLFSAWIATFLVWLWRKDESIEHADYSMLLNAAAIIWLACAIAATPYMINSSKVVAAAFQQCTIVDKEIVQNSHSWEETSYYVYLEPEEKLTYSRCSLSKQYYGSVYIGDKIPVCIYTGILGKQFFSLFEDPKRDFYGYNQWARDEYRKYLSEQYG